MNADLEIYSPREHWNSRWRKGAAGKAAPKVRTVGAASKNDAHAHTEWDQWPGRCGAQRTLFPAGRESGGAEYHLHTSCSASTSSQPPFRRYSVFQAQNTSCNLEPRFRKGSNVVSDTLKSLGTLRLLGIPWVQRRGDDDGKCLLECCSSS